MALKCGKLDAGNNVERGPIGRVYGGLDIRDFVMVGKSNDMEVLGNRRLDDPLRGNGRIGYVV